LEYRIKALELNMLKGSIGEHVARSFIRNTLAPRLIEEEKWDHVVFSHNDYKQNLNAWNEKLFSFDRFREDFRGHGFCANMKLLSKYAMAVGVLAHNHCTPDGLLLKLRETGRSRRVKKRARSLKRSRSSQKPEETLKLPVVDGGLEVVEIKCGRHAKLMSKQKETYNDLIAKCVPLRLVEVRIVSFDRNRFLVTERRFERFL